MRSTALTALRRLAGLGLVLLLAGCAAAGTFVKASSDTAAGGRLDQERAAAEKDKADAQARNAALQKARADRDAELRANDERLKAVDADLRLQDQQLAKLSRQRGVSQARQAELKKQIEDLRTESQALALQNKADAMKATPDPKLQADKLKKLREIEDRKKNLEQVVAQLAAGK